MNSPFAAVALTAVPILLVLIVIVVFTSLQKKKRREGMVSYARGLGLECTQALQPVDLQVFGQFKLANIGRGKKVANVIVADSGELRMTIFDYHYTTGSGKNQSHHRQSVVLSQSQSLSVPDFTLSPESFLHRIGQFFGLKDINFEDDPDFSKAFQLHGSSETAVRAFFTPERRKILNDLGKFNLEARGRNFLFYHPRRRYKPEELKTLMEQAFSTFSALS